ncbi:MAG: NUDIX domain-containing protein, partial [Sphingomonas sp.]|nr:NUDIX domain-containing protein [Sphingomonas sp.]
GLGYYARARNLLACARAVVSDHGGIFPADEATLRTLPGIGDYTAAAISAIAFGRRAVVIDGNVERVIARLFAIDTPLPAARPLIRRAAESITPAERAGDFAQAMMDLSAGLCRPRAPDCLLCPLRADCRATATGTPDAFPVEAPKAIKPKRFGTVFWIERNDHVLLVRRPDKGLLGGMRALPTGPWLATAPGLMDAPLPEDDWHIVEGCVTHVFTHFRLELVLAVASARGHSAPVPGEWWAIDALDSAGLPTVFTKAARLGRR